MRALVSGQAALAVCVDGGAVHSFELDAAGPVRRELSDIPILLANSSDVHEFDCETYDQAVNQLELAWKCDRAFHLSLLLLDKREDRDLRVEASDCLDELLLPEGARVFVANRLYSAPLPTEADASGALTIAVESGKNVTASFLEQLVAHQAEIAERQRALLDIPDSLFGGAEAKERFRATAIEAGAFRLFVAERGRGDIALFDMLVHPAFRGDARARSILQAWARPFKESIENIEFPLPDVDDSHSPGNESKRLRTIPGREMFLRVESQRDAIKKLLAEGHRDRAVRYTEQLIRAQRSASEREHLAKSLCDLAMFAKRMGDPVLQLQFSLRAASEVPEDAWSHAQAGDAYRALGDYDLAMSEYQTTGALGDERVALLGRAEILKDLGQQEESLAIYDRCIAAFPGDPVAMNGRAAALAAFGRFRESLELYEPLCQTLPVDPVSLSGRAEVFREMGELDQALRQFDDVLTMFPEEEIPSNARGEVLREMGRYDEALKWFQQVSRRFPLSSISRNGAAKVLKEMGRFDEALAAYQQVAQEFPLDHVAPAGAADVQKRRGALDDALSSYSALRQRFPHSVPIRNGMAAVLAALGRYEEALALLPRNLPATLSEWVAYHIRGMTYLRSGDLHSARRVLEHGLAQTPWAQERAYFRTALASLEIRSKKYIQALRLLEAPTTPTVEPLVALLRIHAHGALGHTRSIRAELKVLQPARASNVVSLRDALRRRYVRARSNGSAVSEARIFQEEAEALLLAA